MKFLMLYYFDEHAWQAMPDAERAAALYRIEEWQAQPEHARPITQTAELRGPDEAITVRLGPAGATREPTVLPGPFVRGDEVLGGFAVIDVAGPDEAVALAASWPTGGSYELWPLVES
jgi:hypothetical protein